MFAFSFNVLMSLIVALFMALFCVFDVWYYCVSLLCVIVRLVVVLFVMSFCGYLCVLRFVVVAC